MQRTEVVDDSGFIVLELRNVQGDWQHSVARSAQFSTAVVAVRAFAASFPPGSVAGAAGLFPAAKADGLVGQLGALNYKRVYRSVYKICFFRGCC